MSSVAYITRINGDACFNAKQGLTNFGNPWNYTPTLNISVLSPHNHLFFSSQMSVQAISWKVQKGLKLNLVHT